MKVVLKNIIKKFAPHFLHKRPIEPVSNYSLQTVPASIIENGVCTTPIAP